MLIEIKNLIILLAFHNTTDQNKKKKLQFSKFITHGPLLWGKKINYTCLKMKYSEKYLYIYKWMTVHNKEPHKLYSLPNATRAVISRRLWWSKHASWMNKRNWKKMLIGRSCLRDWKNNSMMVLWKYNVGGQEVGLEIMFSWQCWGSNCTAGEFIKHLLIYGNGYRCLNQTATLKTHTYICTTLRFHRIGGRKIKDKKKRTYINININGEGFTKGQSILVEIPMDGDRLLFNPQPYV